MTEKYVLWECIFKILCNIYNYNWFIENETNSDLRKCSEVGILFEKKSKMSNQTLLIISSTEAEQSKVEKLLHSYITDGKMNCRSGKFTVNFECFSNIKESALNRTISGDNITEIFDYYKFNSLLNTKQLGQLIFYFDSVSSTSDFLCELEKILPGNVIAIARSQTAGRGRGGTKWTSNIGCSMFSFKLELKPESLISKFPSYLGYITALSIIEAINSFDNLEKLNTKIKWPNDILTDKLVKIGGTLHDFINDSVIIGCGVNLFNHLPTTCINDMISEYNLSSSCKSLKQLTNEEFIALFLNHFEKNLSSFQLGKKVDIIKAFWQHWLHENKPAILDLDGNIDEVIVTGINEKGFLVLENQRNENYAIPPKGMSFDIETNTIKRKIIQGT